MTLVLHSHRGKCQRKCVARTKKEVVIEWRCITIQMNYLNLELICYTGFKSTEIPTSTKPPTLNFHSCSAAKSQIKRKHTDFATSRHSHRCENQKCPLWAPPTFISISSLRFIKHDGSHCPSTESSDVFPSGGPTARRVNDAASRQKSLPDWKFCGQ